MFGGGCWVEVGRYSGVLCRNCMLFIVVVKCGIIRVFLGFVILYNYNNYVFLGRLVIMILEGKVTW